MAKPWIVSPEHCDRCNGRDYQRKYCWRCWLEIRFADLRRRSGRNPESN